MKANHKFMNAFSTNLDLPKSNISLIMKFLFSRALTLIAIALEKFESPAIWKS